MKRDRLSNVAIRITGDGGMQAAMAGRPYKCFIAPDTRLPMLYMPDCLRATLELILAPHAHLRRCTYNLTAMSFTPADLEASIRAVRPNFQVRYCTNLTQGLAQAVCYSWRKHCIC
jgi:hypothetical protein